MIGIFSPAFSIFYRVIGRKAIASLLVREHRAVVPVIDSPFGLLLGQQRHAYSSFHLYPLFTTICTLFQFFPSSIKRLCACDTTSASLRDHCAAVVEREHRAAAAASIAL